MSESLILYSMFACPYCRMVLSFMEDHDISIEVRDTIENPAYRQELIAIGGKSQVPCLVHNGTALYESMDIITWLKNHYNL